MILQTVSYIALKMWSLWLGKTRCVKSMYMKFTYLTYLFSRMDSIGSTPSVFTSRKKLAIATNVLKLSTAALLSKSTNANRSK